MRVLWLTYIVFPEVNKFIGVNNNSKSGGWLFSSANELSLNKSIELFVASPSYSVNDLQRFEGERITYYLYPYGKGVDQYNVDYGRYYRQIISEISPDIVHIHGFESTIPISYFNSCGNRNVVVSIQGLVSGITKYYNYGLSAFDIVKSITIRDLFRCNTLFHQKKNFSKKAKLEVEAIKRSSHVIGRTNWDKSHILSINPSVEYHFCNETLRPEFYLSDWKYENCSKHTVFVTQASYPLKGLHILLKAIPLLLNKYPDIQIRVAGSNRVMSPSIRDRLRMTGFENYLRKEIKRLHIEHNVVFLGALDVNEIIQEYLSANVFVCPSSIENSSNSLCEAQVLGVPCIASFVGGSPDLIKNSEMGYLYRFEEVEMLSYYIDRVFEESPYFNNSTMKSVARARHSPENNRKATLAIYSKIIMGIR